MRFTTSIFMLLTAVCAVISAYFVGHGIVVDEAWPWFTALVLLGVAGVCGAIYLRLAKNAPKLAAHEHGHEHH